MLGFKYFVLAALPCVLALPSIPAPTATLEVLPELLKRQPAPAPTVKPRVAFEEFAPWKRQSASGSASSFLSSGGTCGFLQGSTQGAFTCSAGRVCAIATAYNAYGCCRNPPNCPLSTGCVAFTALQSCGADANCAGDSYLTKCGSTDPYCNQLVLSGGANAPATAWQCDSIPASFTLLATATDGGKGTASYAFVQLNIPTTSSITSSTPTSLTITSPTSSFSPTPTPPPEKKVPIGAIVGGTVGGVVAIAALIIAAFIFWKRSKKHHPEPVPQQPPQEMGTGGAVGGSYNYGAPAGKETYNPNAVSPNPSHNSPQFNQAGVQRQSEIYSPPQSPSPQYSPGQPTPPQGQAFPHANIAEVDGTGIGHQSGPMRPY